MQAFPIAAVSPDSSAVVIEVGSFFASDQKPFRPFLDASPLAKLFGLRESMQGKFQKEMSGVVSMQAFPIFERGWFIRFTTILSRPR